MNVAENRVKNWQYISCPTRFGKKFGERQRILVFWGFLDYSSSLKLVIVIVVIVFVVKDALALARSLLRISDFVVIVVVVSAVVRKMASNP